MGIAEINQSQELRDKYKELTQELRNRFEALITEQEAILAEVKKHNDESGYSDMFCLEHGLSAYLQEYRTIRVSGPRQIGKTTAVIKRCCDGNNLFIAYSKVMLDETIKRISELSQSYEKMSFSIITIADLHQTLFTEPPYKAWENKKYNRIIIDNICYAENSSIRRINALTYRLLSHVATKDTAVYLVG